MLTSTKSEHVKYITKLQTKARFRKEQGLFVCEGRRLVAQVPEPLLQQVYVTERFLAEDMAQDAKGDDTPARIAQGDFAEARTHRASLFAPSAPLAHAPREVVSEAVMARMSDVGQAQGILAVVRQPRVDTDEVLRLGREAGRTPLLLFLENIQDPGNLGTILRTAEAAGVSAVVASEGTVDLYSPKVVRSTMGSLFRVPYRQTAQFTEEIAAWRERGMQILATLPREGSISYDAADMTEPTGLVIGNEGNGLTADAIAQATQAIHIPMGGQIESLNAGVATGIVLYEAARQRRYANLV